MEALVSNSKQIKLRKANHALFLYASLTQVDYRPEKIDTKALRDGAFVELINLSPLDGMILTVNQVDIENETGFGAVLSLSVRHWINDVASTQLYKFLTSTRYLEPIAHVGSASADLFVLPWEALQNGESVTRALRAGVHSLSGGKAKKRMHSVCFQFSPHLIVKDYNHALLLYIS